MSMLITEAEQGKLPNGEEVAVKRLNQDYSGNQTKQIESEEHLRNLEHRNIVRLIGYCHETVPKPVRSTNNPEEYIFRDVTESLLCYELLSGNLEDNIWPKGMVTQCTFYPIFFSFLVVYLINLYIKNK